MAPIFAAGLFGLGPMEILVVVVIGVLLFGKRLPDMGRYLGKSITEFKKGMHGLEDSFEDMASRTPPRRDTNIQEPLRPPQRVASTAPKFEDAPSQTTPHV